MSRLVPFLQRFALTSWYWRLWIHAESAAEKLLPFWWVPEDRAWWPEKKAFVVHQAVMPAAASEQAEPPSATSGMNLAQRIAHVGGRTNAAGYVEFGSEMAVDALIRHVLRDLRATPSPASPAGKRATHDQIDSLADNHRVFGPDFDTPALYRFLQAYDALATQPLAEQEPSRPDILERLTYHQLEREDLSLDDCLSYLANGWSEIPGRTPRQMVLQILALLAGRHGPVVAGEVLDELARATAKFPTWPTDPLHAIAVLGEEFGELTKAMLQLTYEPHKSSRADAREEAIQTSAMALRLAMSLERYEYSRCYQHVQRGV